MTLASNDQDFEVLNWDTARFGFPVARIDGAVEPNALDDTIRRMRDRGVVLAYYTIDERRAPMLDSDAARFGARLVDTRVTFVSQLAPRLTEDGPADSISTKPANVTRSHVGDGLVFRSGDEKDLGPRLIDLARESGRYSRFRVDPRIDVSVFHSIYDAWLMRSLRREIADEVLVATHHEQDVGFVTVSRSGSCGTIGLLSVGESMRGRGLGRLLTRRAFEWSASTGCAKGRVVTQLANSAACAMYQAAGCVAEKSERVYHVWLT
jgi:dTDP-4-amino-4,6-dideoxy-D-galactose acyltransferase